MTTGNRIDTEYLRQILDYAPEIGVFTWKRAVGPWKSIPAGTVAGASAGNSGYMCIGIDGKNYSSHRLAWQHYYGEVPPLYIDHINRIKNDNRIANLREADRYQNAQNTAIRSSNTTGYRGVTAIRQKFMATVKFNKRQINLGTFKTAKEASDFYESVATKLFTHYEGRVE